MSDLLQQALYEAVRHVLNRTQTDPEFRWHMLHTESMERLVRAEAAYLGQPYDEVMAKRMTDCQPTYRRREPACAINRARVGELERRVIELERLLEEHDVPVPERGDDD